MARPTVQLSVSEEDFRVFVLQALEHLMAIHEEFGAELTRLTTAVGDMRTEVDTQLAQMRAVLDQLAANKPITQAQLDQLRAAADSIETSSGALRADNPVPEPPAPTPGPA